MESKLENEQVDESTNTTFAWSGVDSSVLQPDQLKVARPLRAWERKPLSPYARGRARSRKIWKRVGPAASQSFARTQSSLLSQPDGSERSPVKAGKKLCLGQNTAVGTQWYRIPSPEKRIVTRSSASNDLLELQEEEDVGKIEEENEDPEGTLIEILHEDGTPMKETELRAMPDNDWHDDGSLDGDAVDAETTRPDTVSPLGDIASERMIVEDAERVTESEVEDTGAIGDSKQIMYKHRAVELPLEFATPVRRMRPINRRSLQAARRRSLPQEFRPVYTEPSDIAESGQDTARSTLDMVEPDAPAASLASGHDEDVEDNHDVREEAEQGEEIEMPDEAEENDEWEDVSSEEDEHESHPDDETLSQSTSSTGHANNDSADASTTPVRQQHQGTSAMMQTIGEEAERHIETLLPTQSPMLRRSPRRIQNSSQTTQETIISPTAVRIINSTPDKDVPTAVSSNDIQQSDVDFDQDTAGGFLIPQTPQSVQKSHAKVVEASPSLRSNKARLSDDTALLTAFLDRMKQDKKAQDKHVEVTRHTEPEDSEVVRQALASTAGCGVLVDIDPNTSSPHKTPAAEVTITASEASIDKSDPDQEEVVEPSNVLLPSTTFDAKESRRARRSNPLSTSALRAAQGNGKLKRTEAQDRDQLTRNNTRSNKNGAVLPKHRVPQLMKELLELSLPTSKPRKLPAKIKAKYVQWMPELVSGSVDAPAFMNEDEVEDAIIDEIEQYLIANAGMDFELTPPEESTATASITETQSDIVDQSSATAAIEADGAETKTPAKTPTSETRIGRRTFKSRVATPAPSKIRDSLPGITKPAAQKNARVTRSDIRKKTQSRLPAPVSSVQDFNLPAELSKKEEARTTSLLVSPAKRRTSLFVARNDNEKNKEEAVSSMQSLASPAKRSRGMMVFGDKSNENETSSFAKSMRETPGLSSPAKKRTRRL